MTIDAELLAFYDAHGFGDALGKRPRLVKVYTGCMLVPLPNIETRRRFLKYHDLHHLVTGYGVGRIGEGEISAWELGTGSAYVSPVLGMMNLIALSTGLILEPGRMWRSFRHGCRSHNVYSAASRSDVESGRWKAVSDLRSDILEVRPPPGMLRALEFGLYVLLAMLIHAGLAIPAVFARFITDTVGGAGIFQAIKPVKRTDLY